MGSGRRGIGAGGDGLRLACGSQSSNPRLACELRADGAAQPNPRRGAPRRTGKKWPDAAIDGVDREWCLVDAPASWGLVHGPP